MSRRTVSTLDSISLWYALALVCVLALTVASAGSRVFVASVRVVLLCAGALVGLVKGSGALALV